MTSEEAKELSLVEVKAIIEEELPGALEAAKPKKRKKKKSLGRRIFSEVHC